MSDRGRRAAPVIRASEDEFDKFFGHVVGQAQIGAGDRDEAQHDSRRLRDLTAVGPLHAMQLGPAGAQAPDRARATAQGCSGRAVGISAAATLAARAVAGAAAVSTAARGAL